MPDRKVSEEAQQDPLTPVSQANDAAAETAYPAEMLLLESERIFGQPRWVLDGALSAAKLTGQQNLTKSQTQKALDDFMSQPDKPHAQLLQQQQEAR